MENIGGGDVVVTVLHHAKTEQSRCLLWQLTLVTVLNIIWIVSRYQIIRALRWQYSYLYSVYTAVSIQFLGLLNMQECSDVKYLNLQGLAGSSYCKFQHAMLQKCRGQAGLPHSNCKKVNIYSLFSYDMLRYRSPVFRRLLRLRWEWIVMTWISSVHFNNTFVSKIQRFIRFFWLPEYIDSWSSSVRVGI